MIISGRHVPRYQEGENLLYITRDLIYRKYRIDVNPAEFKILHRLAGGRILFALHSRMPGLGYNQIVQNINSNPNPGVEIYITVQLFEPYSDLYYIARRLKFFNKISYYRLDENGVTYIAINENSRAFKFTNLDQLRQLHIEVPQQLYNEIYQRKVKNLELERQNAAQIISKAHEQRPIVQQHPAVPVPSGSHVQQQGQYEIHIQPPISHPASYSENVNNSAPNNTAGFANSSQQQSSSGVNRPSFRFPKVNQPQSRRDSVKRGRPSSSTTSSPLSAPSAVVDLSRPVFSAPAAAVNSSNSVYNRFYSPSVEQPRLSVQHLIQSYPGALSTSTIQ